MQNLWEETIVALKDYGLTWEDVDAVILDNEDVKISKGNFEEVARNTFYDNDFGAVEVRGDLIIIGRDWWLERNEYDGSEWWEFRTMPPIPDKKITVTKLTTGDWGR